MSISPLSIWFLRVLVFIAATIAHVNFAASADPVNPPPSSVLDSAASAQKVEEITVLGHRQGFELERMSAFVSVISEDAVNEVSNEHSAQYLSRTPGVWLNQGSGQEYLPSIRSPVFTGAGACGAFWNGQDGIALRAKGFCNVNQLFDAHLFAAEQVEVYRGPFASLLGSNALFGGVNVATKEVADMTASLSLQGSSRGYARVGLQGHTAAAGSRVGAVLSMTHNDSWRESSGYGHQHLTLKQAATVNEWTVTNTLSVMHLEQETAGYIEGTGAYKYDALVEQNPNPEAYRDADSLLLYSRWQKQFTRSNLNITPYYRKNSMAFLMHFVPWQPTETNQQESLGTLIHWQRPLSDRARWFSFLDLETTEARLNETQYDPAPFAQDRFVQGPHYDYQVDAQSVGAGLGLQYDVFTDVVLDVVVRADWDRWRYENALEDGWACEAGVTGCRFYRPADQTTRFKNTAFNLGLSYQWTQEITAYARLSNGYRLPQATELYRAQSDQNHKISPPRLQAFEVGARGLSGPLRWNAALYVMQQTDGLYQDTTRAVVNGVETDHKGLEYELSLPLNSFFTLALNGTFADHTYANTPQVLGLMESADIYGKTIDSAVKNQHFLTLNWVPTGRHQLKLSVESLGEYPMDPENQWIYPGHHIVNVSGYTDVGPWRWSLGVTNSLNTSYANRADVSFGIPRYFPAAGSTVSLGVRYQPN